MRGRHLNLIAKLHVPGGSEPSMKPGDIPCVHDRYAKISLSNQAPGFHVWPLVCSRHRGFHIEDSLYLSCNIQDEFE